MQCNGATLEQSRSVIYSPGGGNSRVSVMMETRLFFTAYLLESKSIAETDCHKIYIGFVDTIGGSDRLSSYHGTQWVTNGVGLLSILMMLIAEGTGDGPSTEGKICTKGE